MIAATAKYRPAMPNSRTLGTFGALLAGLSLLVWLAIRLSPAEHRLELRQPASTRAVAGFHDVECNGARCYRWSRPAATIYLHAVDGQFAVITMDLSAPAWPDSRPTSVRLAANDQPIGTIVASPAWRAYSQLVPLDRGGDLTLTLQSAAFHPGGADTRQLGVALSAITIRPIGAPTSRRIAFLLLLPLVGWGVARSAGVARAPALAIGCALAALAAWAGGAPAIAGYWLPTVDLQARIVPLLLLCATPAALRYCFRGTASRAREIVLLLLIALLSLRIGREIALGLAVLTAATLGLVAQRRQRAGAARESAAGSRQPAALPAASLARPALPALTGVRFFAAFAVVLFHYERLLPLSATAQAIVGQGAASVGLFFILSGFIMVYTYGAWFRTDLAHLRLYAQARFARIYPVYVLALLTATPLVLYYVRADPANRAAGLTLDSSWIANLALVHVYLLSDHYQTLWNSPSWSIATEAFFYVCCPFLLRFVFARFRRVRAVALFALACFVLEILAFALCVAYLRWLAISAEDFDLMMLRLVYRSPLLRVWEFLIGMCLGIGFLLLRERTPRAARPPLDGRPLRNAVLALTLLAIGAVAAGPALYPLELPLLNELRWYIAYTPLFALLIGVLAWGPTFASPILAHPWVVRLGEASYALYIIHFVVRSYLPLFIPVGTPQTAWLALLAIGMTVLASLAIFVWIETPARRWLRA